PTDAGYALYAPTRTSCRYAVIDLNGSSPTIEYEFEIAPAGTRCGDQPDAVLSDDGNAVFMVVNLMDASGRSQVLYVEGPNGAVSELKLLNAAYGAFTAATTVDSVLLMPRGATSGMPEARIYDWDGTLAGAVPIGFSTRGAGAFALSPDATALAWQEM